MNDKTNREAGGCAETRTRLQEYLDRTLTRRESMAVFLHVRECAACASELEALRGLFAGLDALPEIEAPADFDARVLASVPYEAYREMEPLRRVRVPVILERESLPAWIRATAVRAVGGTAAVLAAAGLLTGALPGVAAAALAGALPELLVRLQSVSRRIYVGTAHRTTR